MAGARRLVELAGFDNPRPGSFIPMLLSVLTTAREAGWDAEMVFDAPAGEPQAWVAEFESAGFAPRFAPPGNRRELGRWLRGVVAETDAPTVLHTHFTTFDMPAVLAARGSSAAHVVWHQHMDLTTRPDVMVRNAIKFGGFGRLTDRILCPAPDTAAAVRRVGGPRDRVEFLPNAIDFERFGLADSAAKAAARDAIGVEGEEVVLLHFGWDWLRKGGDLYLEAAKALRDRGRGGFFAVTVTDHPDAEPLSEQLGLGAEARIVPPQPDVQALYAAADAFVAPSRAEGGTPYALLEALASGVPVIASDIAGHRYVAGAVDGCEVYEGGSEGLAAALEVALDSLPLDEAGARAVRGQAQERFALPTWSRGIVSQFDEIAG